MTGADALRARSHTQQQNLEEAQTYVMLRRAYASDALPASVDDACILAVTRTYFAERAALLRCTSQLAALAASGDDAAAPAHDALAKLLDKVGHGCVASSFTTPHLTHCPLSPLSR